MRRWRELLEGDWAELLPMSQTLPWIGILVTTHFCSYITLLLKRIDTLLPTHLPKESELQALPLLSACRLPLADTIAQRARSSALQIMVSAFHRVGRHLSCLAR